MSELTADCARCAALCCRLSSFDRGPDFSFTKASGEACRHLTSHNACGVHPRRFELGLSGCVAFDCHGAGQSLAGLTGDDAIDVAAFHALIELHFCLRLVELAERLGLEARVAAHKEVLLAYARLPPAQLAVLDTSGLRIRLAASARTS